MIRLRINENISNLWRGPKFCLLVAWRLESYGVLAAREATVKNCLPMLRGTGKCSFDENIALNFAGFFGWGWKII